MHVKISFTVKTVDGISSSDGRKLKESERYNYFFVVLYVLGSNRSAFVRDLLSNKSQFVGRDLIYFTNDLQSVIYYSTDQC